MYQIPQLLKLSKLIHAFSEKEDGNMANSINGRIVNFSKVYENRKKFLSKANVDLQQCVCMWVVHDDEAKIAPSREAGKSMQDYMRAVKVDGLVTNQKDLYLF